MPAPDEVTITVSLRRGGPEGFSAQARSQGSPGLRGSFAAGADEENPFEAAWNALARVMQYLQYDHEEAR